MVQKKEGKGGASTNNSSSCDAYKMDSHELEGCWYAFPEEAPEDFHPNRMAENLLNELIKANKGLAAKIGKIREEKKKKTESS